MIGGKVRFERFHKKMAAQKRRDFIAVEKTDGDRSFKTAKLDLNARQEVYFFHAANSRSMKHLAILFKINIEIVSEVSWQERVICSRIN